MRTPWPLVLLALLMGATACLYGQNTNLLVVDRGFENAYLDDIVTGYVDSTSQLYIHQIVVGRNTAKPWPVNSAGHMVNMGYSRDTWWLNWELLNNTGQQQRLRVFLGSGIITTVRPLSIPSLQ